MTRAEVLEQAKKCVCGDREDDYGSPEDNFTTIAELWRVYLQRVFRVDWLDLQADDVAAMMILLKISRIVNGGHGKADNWVDIAGYAACGGELDAETGAD